MRVRSHYLIGGLFIFGTLSCVSGATILKSFGGTDCGTSGLCTSMPGATTVTFDGLLSFQASTYTDGFATYTWSSLLAPFASGFDINSHAPPPNDLTTYLAVGAWAWPETVTLTFARPVHYFGFFIGSPDDYNSVAFTFAGAQGSQTISGLDLLPPADGNQSIGQFINFSSSAGFSQIQFTSTPTFETDNHAYLESISLPEPGTFVILGTGLLALGVLRLRRSA